VSAGDLALAIGLAVVFAAVFGALFDLAPLIAKAMVRQAARWWHSELDTPDELAAEWQALIEARPVGILKIGTGLRFWLQGALRHSSFAIERRAERAPRSLGRALVWLSGAQKEVLDICPTERPKFVGIAAAVLLTGTVAAVSLTFTLVTILKVPMWLALLFAFLWGFAVLNLDRWLVVSVSRQKNRWSYLILAIPRLTFALLFGVLISTPIVLQVFRPEINAQIPVIQAQRAHAYLAQLADGPLSKQINQDRARIVALEYTVNSTASAQADQARSMLPAVQQALARDQAKQRNLTAAFMKENSNDGGLLISLQALDNLASHDATLAVARWLLLLFFTAIECLPVLAKTLMVLGPESLYEKVAAIVEQRRLKMAVDQSLRQSPPQDS
jgi:hypothetical protein